MRKIMLVIATVAVSAAFCGCSSVSVAAKDDLNGEKLSASGAPVAHIQAESWGLYLFMLPLLTGSTDTPGGTVAFKDTVTVAQVSQMMTAKSKELGGRGTYNMVSRISTNPWFIGIKEVQISANVVR